jgi:thiol-disulfide isomerase/thioredoxin
MKPLRHWVPIFGILALVALFFKLPEIPSVFDLLSCKTCASTDPYLPLMGAAYFSILIAASLLFPGFPGPQVARGGLTWAVLLALTLTYLDLPRGCIPCLIGHVCNILIWTIWVIVPSRRTNQSGDSRFKERFCLMLFMPISVVALFSCLNLTFMAYGFKNNRSISTAGLHIGEAVPNFTTQTREGRSVTNVVSSNTGLIINFVSPHCPHCKEQLLILNTVAEELVNSSFRLINISPALSPELIQNSAVMEWVEDKEDHLRKLFKVSGYPTLFVMGSDGKIVQILLGVPDQLKNDLLTSALSLAKP